MFCTKCGTQVTDDNAEKCPGCGAELRKPAIKKNTPRPTPPPPPPPAQAKPISEPTPEAVRPAAPVITPVSTGASDRDWVTTFFLAFFLGSFGVDRFYTGSFILGILKLVTCGGFGLWALVDIVLLILGSYKDGNGNMISVPRLPDEPASGKDWKTTTLLALFLGVLGVDRFYAGHSLLGILKLVTFGGCGLWAMVDIILLALGMYKDGSGNQLVRS
ncbi:MAG TPA: TM2 domain-containing protein [bacterium]|nr:TM2 domain-containing protein [bacterium]